MHEAGNALRTGIRRGRWSGADADAAHAHLQLLPVALVDLPADAERRTSSLGDTTSIRSVMVYLPLAERLSATLVTA